MANGRGKGRISNELVAASCAAVLAVYAAGYWRTREEARRIEAREQERRPVRTAGLTAAAPAVAPAIVPVPDLPDVPVPARTAPTVAAKTLPVAPVQRAQPAPSPTASAKTSSAPVIASTSEASAPAITATVEPASAPTQPPASASASVLPSPPPPAAVSETPPGPSGKWRDGTYTGWGTSRHGDIKAQVVIRDGRIMEAGIASCETRYPCDVIDKIIPQPVARQSPDVDAVSRATESADAYYFALVEALKDAEAPATGHAPSSP